MPVAKEQIRQIISENNISNVADVYSLLEYSFKDILQELLDAELDASLGYEKNQKSRMKTSNKRNGHSPKKLKSNELFYDRRKNYYKNQGKKSHEIVNVSFLAQCLIALLLEQTEQARARPSTLLTDDVAYGKLYERDHNLSVYFHAAKIGKKVDRIIKEFTDLLPLEKRRYFIL